MERLVGADWLRDVRGPGRLPNTLALKEIQVEDLPEKIRNRHTLRSTNVTSNELPEMVTLEEVDRRHVLRVLAACHGNRTNAAKVLELDRKTLYRKLLRWGVDARARRPSPSSAKTATSSPR
jgi:transcriptional regulator of acetoin/glycerol metabolism